MSTPSLVAPPMLSPQRLAVSLMFLANGFVVGSWAPKIPEFAARLQLDESELGLMIMCFGVGSLCAMPAVGAMISREGSRRLMLLVAAATVPCLMLVTLAPSIWTAALALFLMGGMIGGMDVAMNANAVEVERRQGRAIMSSCHGFWSLGGVAGAALGGVLIELYGVQLHAVIACSADSRSIGHRLAPGSRRSRRTGECRGRKVPLQRRPRPGLLAAGATVWLTGIICLIVMTPEGAILDWGALYLRQELGADPALSGLAFGAFSAAMALMRFLGDLVRDRFGAVRTFRVSAVLAMIGLTLAGLATIARAGHRWLCDCRAGLCQHRPDRLFGCRQPARTAAGTGNLRGHLHGLLGHPLRALGYRLHRRAHRFCSDLPGAAGVRDHAAGLLRPDAACRQAGRLI
jgi:predicted MFS family arabinose efflux permease